MKIVRIHGGLGNQIFCYAFALYLFHERNAKVSLDVVSGFKGDFYKRAYKLDNFHISLHQTNDKQVRKFNKILQSKILRTLDRVRKRIGYNLIYFEKSHLEKEDIQIKNEIYFSGYWQSYKYSKDIIQRLKEELKPKRDLFNSTLNNLANKIESQNSVSVHVRYPHAYSDNKVSKKALEKFNILKQDYYSSAFELLRSKFEGITFYIFSDNIPYAKQLLGDFSDLNYVQGNNEIQDFWLFQHSRHFVIANSTFSWWCARLGEKQNSTIICPGKWYYKQESTLNDLLPNNWIKL